MALTPVLIIILQHFCFGRNTLSKEFIEQEENVFVSHTSADYLRIIGMLSTKLMVLSLKRCISESKNKIPKEL